MKRVMIRMAVLTVLMFSALGVSHAMGQFMFLENPLKGKAAPDFTLPTMAGGSASLSSLRGESPALVFFWATWCPHCREQLGDLHAQGPAMAQKGIKVILVDLQESRDRVQAHLKKLGTDFPVLLDEDGEVAGRYGIVGVPTFYLIDKDGIVRVIDHVLPEEELQALGAPGM